MLVRDIQYIFKKKWLEDDFAENGTLEIINANFIADEPTIFGKVSLQYANRELAWYLDKNLNISGLEPNIPQIWQDIADKDGYINSNYGWCIHSEENHNQYLKCIEELLRDPASRQGVMLYTRPTMHEDSKKNGMHDFMCTYATQLLIRKNKLHYMVFMRSSDAVFGFKNDLHWHKYVQGQAWLDLQNKYPDLEPGPIYWNAGSLHVYPRHFYLVDEYEPV